VGDFVGPERAATVFSTITFFFAIGQTVGPAMAGALADATGTFDVSFAVIALLGIIAIFGTLGLPKRAKR
jgi:MFS family permease